MIAQLVCMHRSTWHDVIVIETMAKQTVVVGGSIVFFICLKYLLSVEVVFSMFVFLEPVCWLGHRFTFITVIRTILLTTY